MKAHAKTVAPRRPAQRGSDVEDLRRLHETAVAVARSGDWREGLRRVLEAAASGSGTTMGRLSLCDSSGGGPAWTTTAGFPDAFVRALDDGLEGAVAGLALARRERVVVEDAASDAIFEGCRDVVRAGGFVASHSVPLQAPDGGVVGVLTLYFPTRRVPDERERALTDLYAQMAADLVARTRAVERLKESEERFRALASHAPVGIFLSDANGESVFLNDVWCGLAGLRPEEARGNGWTKAIHPDDRERIVRDWEEAVRVGRSSSAEYRFVRPDGSTSWVQGNAVQLRDAAGKVTGHIGTVVDITERKVAELAVRESERRLRLATHAGRVGVWDWEIAENRVTWTESLFEIHGISPGEFAGTVEAFAELVHPEDREQVQAALQRALTGSGDYELEFRAVRPDGQVVWLFTNAVVLKHGGVPVRMLGATLDVTERRQGEETTRQLAAIVESSDDAIISTDLQGTITSWNRGAERLYGYTREEAIGRSLAMLLPPGREQEEPAIVERISRGERLEHYETTRRHKSGRLREVSLTVSPVLGADGKPIGTSKIARDITERKRAEAELRRQQQLYRAVGESIDFGIWVCDAQGRNIYCSESFLKLVGLTQEEASGAGWARVLAPEQVGPTVEAWKRCVETGGFWEREHLFKGVDGQWHPVLARGVPIRDEDGRVTYWAGINLDIAAFKQTEAALRRGEERLRLVTDNAIVFLAHCDREYRLKFVNRPYAQRFGRTPDELVGKRIDELIGATAFAAFKPRIDEALGGRRVEFEMEIPYERFGRRWMRVIHEPEREADGQVIGIVAVITDVTARKQAERDMETARDKAEAASRAKDDFLATLSHELRTPLNPVLLLASEHAGDPALPDEAREAFRTIRKNVEFEARLIDDLLDLTRITRGKLSLDLSVHDAHVILQDAVATMRPELEAKRIGLRFDLQARRTRVWADAVRMQQVLWNVLKNAAKFTPEGGRVSVVTRDLPADGRVAIEISDTGIGMTEAELARVFDAFSQGDHARGGGSHRFGGVGLGLAISRMIVEMHRGTVRAASEGPGRGSAFTIELPVDEVPEAATAAWAGSRRPTASQFWNAPLTKDGVRTTLLLVEDHEATRTALAHLLKRRNFDVVPAGCVEEAREAVARGGIDLVISDIGLPDGSGYDLMAELKRGYGLSGIALTGYGMDQDVVRSQASGFVVHLTKPVTVQALEKALKAALSGE